MADDPNKQGYRDRTRVAGDQDYEVRYFAEQNGVSEEQTRELIKKHGNMRNDLERDSKKLRQA